MNFSVENAKIAIIGLGYVGLPLAVEFGKRATTIGFDINHSRIVELSLGHDATLECNDEELAEAKYLSYTSSLEELRQCNVYIVTVPTPIDKHKQPDLTPLIKASDALGTILSEGDVIIYESTVYPGATEEECIPVVEKVSGLVFNQDFYAGYSPERINPGDKEHRVTNILKVTSGSTPQVAEFVDQLYKTIITAGTHKASSIKVAEAAKVIENTQRDMNIALINELAIIFDRLNIDTLDVLKAAGTKWNFLPFRPGLVGGHCIGVDPYYLTHKSKALGYIPDMIIAGRRVNDTMSDFVVTKLIRHMIKKKIQISESRLLIMGLTFKENCPDIRNTKIVELINKLKSFDIQVDVIDPWCDASEVEKEFAIELKTELAAGYYDGVLMAVGHDQFKALDETLIKQACKNNAVIFDMKNILSQKIVDCRL